MNIRCVALLSLIFLLGIGITATQAEVPDSIFKHLRWRNIGPANMAGRVADIEGIPGNPNILYVGSASGGVWKTVNGGTTWKPIFDQQPTMSIGDLALEPGNPDVIYVGTGEANVRNSVSFGNGIYKSTDGGKSWVHLGLHNTEHISRVVVNPKNPRIVFAGALGHAYGPNSARGVFRTEDGGRNWQKVLYLDDKHGVSDIDINPANPNIVYAALWRFERKPWTFTSGDTLGGVFKSIDGGLNWEKLGNGLPSLVGRIGVKVAPSDPDVVYAITESPEGTLYRSNNGGESFQRVSQDVEIVSRGFYYTDLRVDPTDENRVYAVSARLFVSIDGGVNFKRISPTTHVDYHSLWIDPLNPRRMWQGQDGGVCVSLDRGDTWNYVNNFPLSQFYQIYADNSEPFYNVGGGLQDNGTWTGPSRNREPFGIMNDDWRMISFGDGFCIVVHPDDPDLFISESQGGGIVRTNMRTREQQDVSPQPRRADGAPVSALKYRFNWNTPIVLSPHDKNTVYVAGNVVFKSTDFGTSWDVISPDLTTDDPDKQRPAGGPAWPENTTAEYHCTIISLAESPLQPDVLWAGTDDGNLHVSMNGGEEWNNVGNSVPDLADYSPVSHLEPSYTSAGMAYCAFDRHMLNDFSPYIYKTTDFGRTWVDISGNLPKKAHVWVVREDPKNPQVLYAGTELGLFVSFSRGDQWTKLHLQNLPAVSVHDIIIHPRDNDLILGTHGRGMWILDSISFIQEFSEELLEQEAYMFTVRPALRFSTKPTRYGIGDGVFTGPNPPYGALIYYYLQEQPGKDSVVELEILDETRQVIRTIKQIPRNVGINLAAWDLRYEGPRLRKIREQQPEDVFFGGLKGPQALSGRYTARLKIGESAFEKPVRVRLDPTVEFSLEDMTIQQGYAFEIRDMTSYINDGLRALDTLITQLEERRKTMESQSRDFPEEVINAIQNDIHTIAGIKDFLERPEGRPFWSEGPRLKGRLGSLGRGIDGVNLPPTRAQVAYFEELKEEFTTALADVNNYLTVTAKALNELFMQHQIPLLLIPPPIEFEIPDTD